MLLLEHFCVVSSVNKSETALNRGPCCKKVTNSTSLGMDVVFDGFLAGAGMYLSQWYSQLYPLPLDWDELPLKKSAL